MTISVNDFRDSSSTIVPTVEIGNAIKQARVAIGYSVEDLAVTCGLTDLEISKIEIGADTDPNRIRRIATALQIPATAFSSV
jgi:transcriptional regulator with XRE-family HTH domain